METRVYLLENLCCANCAAKIEQKINAMPQVQEAVLTFTTRQLRVSAQDPDTLLEEMTRIARSVEEDVKILPQQTHTCGCGGHHEHNESCGCGGHHHAHSEGCGCGGHHHDHGEGCGCGGHHHDHGEGCGCGGHHHDHGEGCSCGGHHHDHGEGCGCGGHHHDHGEDCGCGHHHEHHDHHHHDHGGENPLWLGIGAALFVAGLLTQGHLSTLICLAAFVLLGWKILCKAVRNLFRGHVLDENFLMSIASLGAFLIGNAPEGVGVLLFYRVGEFFEHRAVERSRSQIMEAVDLRPEVVHLVEGDQIRTVPAQQARPGDIVLVRPGDRIPLDGIVESGESRIDTAPITGEPVPVSVKPGSQVISGCVNTVGQLTLRVEKPLAESMVTRILKSVETAAAGKPRIDRFITRFARIYTPVVVIIAILTAVVPGFVTGNWQYWVYTALSFLVMSCPCALVLSVPLAFFAGIGAGSRKGILFKGGASMEAMRTVRAVVMDKTGTLTKGDFRVCEVDGGDDLLALCAACEELSSHPIAVSITQAAREKGLTWSRPQHLEEIPGRGIRATVDGRAVLLGSRRLMEEKDIVVPQFPAIYGTRVYASADGAFLGSVLISDTVKADASDSVAQLHSRGYATAMLTGDGREAAELVSKQLSIGSCHAGLLPQQKLTVLQSIRKEKGAVMFVGDGINDAPVLAGADVGAAMGSGADAAIEAADVVFMTGQTSAIVQALDIARKTWRIAWQNVVFALSIKFIVMALGLLGFASMWLAVFADSGVAMLCVLNSIRLLYRRK